MKENIGLPKVEYEALEKNKQYELSLACDGKQSEASHQAIIKRSGDGDLYREVAVEIYDAKGNLDACLIVGLDAETLEPVIHCTTDGDGFGDMNVALFPMRGAEDCVDIDVYNSQIQRNQPKAN